MRPKSRHEASETLAEEERRSRSSTCSGVLEEKTAATATTIINAASPTYADPRQRKEPKKGTAEEKRVRLIAFDNNV